MLETNSSLSLSHTEPLPESITEAGKLIRSGNISIIELTKGYLERIRLLNPALNAFITITEEEALKEAAVLQDEARCQAFRGPLHGIPMVYKDNIATQGVLTTMGSRFYKEHVPEEDAEVVRKLRQAGTIILGKTNMNEFAAGVAGYNDFFGNPSNPWDHKRWPGGSSSGTGVAICSGMSLAGLGTDTGVSVRGPSGWLGLTGLRPSYGRVSVRGTFPRAYSFDTVGPMAHTVQDTALLLNTIAGHDPKDPFSVRAPQEDEDFTRDLHKGVKKVRLGIVDNFTFSDISSDIGHAVQSAVETFEKLGAVIQTVKIPLFSDRTRGDRIDARYPLTILLYEFNKIISAAYDNAADKELFGEVVRNNIRDGRMISEQAYSRMKQQRAHQIAEIRGVFDEVDALLTPTHPFVAPAQSVNAESDINVRQFTVPVSYSGFPAISIPCGFSSTGLPIGLQIVANDFQEHLLFRVAAAFEAATEFFLRRPWAK